jgi:hypothetical protein
MEISSVNVGQGTWETSTNVFSDRILQSFLVTFDCGTATGSTALLIDGDTVTSGTG